MMSEYSTTTRHSRAQSTKPARFTPDWSTKVDKAWGAALDPSRRAARVDVLVALKPPLLFIALLFAFSCATRRPLFFRVLPAEPSYLLRSPDSKDIPFPEVLGRYTDVGPGWVDLRPKMGLRVENAYFREGAPKRGIDGFIGTEVAQYRARTRGGLQLIAVESNVPHRPKDQPAVQNLLPAPIESYTHHRFLNQVTFRSKGEVRGAVLLGASTKKELDQLGAQLLIDPDSVCSAQFVHCTIFPEACTVSLQIEIVVNGAPRTVLWGSPLGTIVEHPRRLELLRRYAGHLVPVEMDSGDSDALHLPLLPGDHVNWE
jgi:hypothetical protein